VAGSPAPVLPLLELHRTSGRRYVQRLIDRSRQAAEPLAAPALKTRLVVGPANDDHEREADRLAEQVTRRPAVQRPRPEEDSSGGRAEPNPRHSRARGFEVADARSRTTPAARMSGRSLPASLKEEFEAEFEADFGAVRVHTGGRAARLSRGLQAQAFTHGSDVYFGAGMYAPGTPAGRRLLAHELTHVVQQGWAPPRRNRGPNGGSTTPVVRAPQSGATPGGGSDRIQRKLSWQHTDWTQAERAWQSAGGGLGVVFVTDERKAPPPTDEPVVVKTGEDAPAEVVLAANLHGFG
jgi:hypothetical protein